MDPVSFAVGAAVGVLATCAGSTLIVWRLTHRAPRVRELDQGSMVAYWPLDERGPSTHYPPHTPPLIDLEPTGIVRRHTSRPGGRDVSDRPVPVLLLDIDGTVREGKDDRLGRFVNGPGDVIVFPEALARMKAWKAGGGRIVGVTNQGGIALGIVDPEQVMAALVETQRQCEGLFDRIAMCQHHPDAEHPEMARCWCRKPRPGLAIEALLSMAEVNPGEIYPPYMALFVGDRPEDEACAEALNVDFVWAREWRNGA